MKMPHFNDLHHMLRYSILAIMVLLGWPVLALGGLVSTPVWLTYLLAAFVFKKTIEKRRQAKDLREATGSVSREQQGTENVTASILDRF